jgi:alternate signal-mediated exported protein
MNKLVKGSVATAVGIALLLGGSGSYALWSQSVNVNAGSVSSGKLTLVSAGDGAWDQSIAKIVPGDHLTYTEHFTVTAVGDNLTASLSSNIASITNSVTGSTATTTFAVVDSSSAAVTPVAGVYTLGEDTYTVTATVVVDFPSAATGGQNGTINLSSIAISLTQVAF